MDRERRAALLLGPAGMSAVAVVQRRAAFGDVDEDVNNSTEPATTRIFMLMQA